MNRQNFVAGFATLSLASRLS